MSVDRLQGLTCGHLPSQSPGDVPHAVVEAVRCSRLQPMCVPEAYICVRFSLDLNSTQLRYLSRLGTPFAMIGHNTFEFFGVPRDLRDRNYHKLLLVTAERRYASARLPGDLDDARLRIFVDFPSPSNADFVG